MFRAGCFLKPRDLKSHSLLFSRYKTNNFLNNNSLKRVIKTDANLVAELPNYRSEKLVGKWLLGCGGMVYVAVALGGVTRLTESGLSMVTWKLLGEQRPRNITEWQQEFERYQQFPEYKLKNRSMTLEEFKFIYFMEYMHRMWGRAIGAVFLIPATYFWARGQLCSKTKKYVVILGSLILLQGLMGWYMVKSGLEDRFQNVNDVPRVSQYRLASHLAVAFTLYAGFIAAGFNKLLPVQQFTTTSLQALRFKRISSFAKGLVFLTAVSGAFVAGLDAGLIYNSFPKMGDNWIPNDILLLKPIQKNITENPTTVQFNHRILGISTVALTSYLWFLSRRTKLPKRAHHAINALFAMACIQSTLGISTLLTYVPTSLAATHQSGSILLLSFAMWLSHELRYVKYIPK